MRPAPGTICSGSRAARSFWTCRTASSRSGLQIQVVAVGSPGAEARLVPRTDIASFDPVATWIRQLARLITGANPSWDMLEVAADGDAAVPPGERRRGPARSIVWVSLASGTAKPMGLDPAIAADGPPLPLTSGMWIEAGQAGCSAVGSEDVPDRDLLWRAIDQFHLGVASCVRDYIVRDADREAQRLVLRSELMTAQTVESFDRLADVVVQRAGHAGMAADPADPLLGACRMVAEAVRAPFVAPPQPALAQHGFAGVVEIARSARLRVRRTLLRGEWWKDDGGPLVAWHGEARNPVALIRRGGRRYVMFDTRTGTQRPVDRSLAMELAPEAASFYPALPARPLRFRDLLAFSFQQATGNFFRIAFAVIAIGLLSLVTPLITNVLISSVIPRSELDQLDVLRARPCRHGDCDRQRPGHAGAGDAQDRRHDGLEAAGGGDRPDAQAAHLAVSRIYRGRFCRPLDGDRRGAAGLHRTRAAQRDVRPVRLVQHRLDVLL